MTPLILAINANIPLFFALIKVKQLLAECPKKRETSKMWEITINVKDPAVCGGWVDTSVTHHLKVMVLGLLRRKTVVSSIMFLFLTFNVIFPLTFIRNPQLKLSHGLYNTDCCRLVPKSCHSNQSLCPSPDHFNQHFYFSLSCRWWKEVLNNHTASLLETQQVPASHFTPFKIIYFILMK